MTITKLRNKADAKLVEFWDLLLPKQESYLLKHGKCFQLLVTSPVIDGADTTFVVTKPNDEKHSVDVDFSFNSPVPFQISVDEWVGDTIGFSVTAIVELPDGRRFIRSRRAVKVANDWSIETSVWSEVIKPII